jgi:hypothetical protein
LDVHTDDYKFDKLQPYLAYDFTVFSRQILMDVNGASGDSSVVFGPPSPITSAMTKAGEPDRPENLRVVQVMLLT